MWANQSKIAINLILAGKSFSKIKKDNAEFGNQHKQELDSDENKI